MSPTIRSALIAWSLAALAVPLSAVHGQGIDAPPKAIPTGDPDKSRSAEENISFGQINSVQDKRLDVRDRLDRAVTDAPAPAAEVIIPNSDDPGASPPAVVDVNPQPPLDIGLKTNTTDKGVIVTGVQEESPAHRAGFLINDLIKRVADRAALTPKDIDMALNPFPPLAAVPFVVMREGKRHELTLMIPPDHKPYFAPRPNLQLRTTPPKITEKEVVRDDAIGWVLTNRGSLVAVMLVQPETPAAWAGLMANDVIVEVDAQHYSDAAQLSLAVHQHREGETAVLWVRRGTLEGTIYLTLPAVAVVPQSPAANGTGTVVAPAGGAAVTPNAPR